MRPRDFFWSNWINLLQPLLHRIDDVIPILGRVVVWIGEPGIVRTVWHHILFHAWVVLIRIRDSSSSSGVVAAVHSTTEDAAHEDALERAADSYGGLTETPYLSPR